jgi:hypothetical protein
LSILIYISRFLKSIYIEALIIFIYIFLINNYIGNVDDHIHADGIGYYDYLPALFIHHDLIRKDTPYSDGSALYDRIDRTRVYIDYHNFKVDKYPCGTALLQLPFFAWTLLTTARTGDMQDGYQPSFQKAVFYAALFYLFLSIFFLKKTLGLYDVKKYVIILSQILLVLATSVTHYAHVEAGFSHVYSLFAITAFIYFTGSYFKNKNVNHFILACLFLGLILILRQINILIILFIPFLAGSFQNLKDGFIFLWRHYKKSLTGISLIFAVFFLQCLLWYLQTGHFLLYSYQGEGFHFLKPHMIAILFSYRKGLFVYTPVVLISMFGLIWLVYRQKYYWVLTWLSFFLILTYVLSSWEYWYYGGSYGMRAYIDYFAIFFIPYAMMVDGLGKGLKTVVIVLSLLAIPLNVIQTYQYKEYILHWSGMDKAKYWEVFLHTENRYKGLLWKKKLNDNDYKLVREIFIGDIHASANTFTRVFTVNCSDIPDFKQVGVIQLLMDNDFKKQDVTRMVLSIDESTGHHIYSHDAWLIHFAGKHVNEWQTGSYNYLFTPIDDPKDKTVMLYVLAGSQNDDFKNVRLRFLSHK